MTHESFNNSVNNFLQRVGGEITRKNADYAGDAPNPYEAFDEVARVLGLTREQVWAVYYMKHVQALTRYIKSGQLDSESIQSRLTDLAAYAAILNAMAEDNKGGVLREAIMKAPMTATSFIDTMGVQPNAE